MQQLYMNAHGCRCYGHVSLQSRLHIVASFTDENFGGGVVDSDGLEDGGAVVGHRHRAVLPTAQQDLVL